MPNGTTPSKMGSSSRIPSQNSLDGVEGGVFIDSRNYIQNQGLCEPHGGVSAIPNLKPFKNHLDADFAENAEKTLKLFKKLAAT